MMSVSPQKCLWYNSTRQILTIPRRSCRYWHNGTIRLYAE